MLEGKYQEWQARDESASAEALWNLSIIELQAGRWALAAEHAARAREIFTQYRREIPRISCRSRSSRFIAGSSSSRARTRSELSSWRRSSSRCTRLSTWQSSESSHGRAGTPRGRDVARQSG